MKNKYLSNNNIVVKSSSHFESCSASICFETIYADGVSDVIWYPGELLCLRNGLSAATGYVLKRQRRINKLVTKGKFKNVDRAFTFEILSKIKSVTVSTKGLNPERPIQLTRFKETTSGHLSTGANAGTFGRSFHGGLQ